MQHGSKSTVRSARLFPLASPRLLLRKLQFGDLEPFLAYRNDPQVSRFQSWDFFSREQAAAFIEQQQSTPPLLPGHWLQLAITLKTKQVLIGDCGVKIHGPDQRQATLGITLAREFQRKGFAGEAIAMLLDFTFLKLGLHRVQADTDPENIPAWRLLERMGMRREAHFTQSLWFKGRWTDEYVYAILQQEWVTRRPSFLEQSPVR